QADPSNTALLLETHRLAGRPEAAVDDLAKLVASNPDEVRYVLAYADVLEKLDRIPEAERVLVQFSQDHPEQLKVYWRLFDLQVRRGAWPQVLAIAGAALRADASAVPAARSKILQLEPAAARTLLDGVQPETIAEYDFANAYLLGCLALREKQTESAEALLDHALQLSPDFLPAKIELGRLYVGSYRWQQCLSALGGPEEGQVGDARVAWLLGEAYAGLDQNEEAAAHFNTAIRLNHRETRAIRSLAQLYERIHEPLRAIRQYQNLLKIDPLDEQSRESLLHLHLANNDRPGAQVQLDQLGKMAASPNRLARCTALMQHDPRTRDYEQLRTSLTQAMETSGPDAQSLMLVADAYLSQARYDEALPNLLRAVELDPDDLDSRLYLHYAYRMTLQFEKSADVLRSLLGRHPNRRTWIDGLIDLLVIDQDFDGALAVIGELLARPDLSEADRTAYRKDWLETLQAARRYDEQIESVRRWCAESPEDLALREMLVRSYLAADRPADALRVVESWHEEAPGNEALQRLYAELLVQTDQAERGRQLVLDWLQEDPDNDRLQQLLAVLLSDSGRYDDALELATNCQIGARDADSYDRLMRRVYEASGRHDEAVKLLSELVADQGSRQGNGLRVLELRLDLGIHLIRGGRYHDAQNRLSRWIEQSRDPGVQVEYLKQLATCHQYRGQIQQAIEALEQAYQLLPLDPGTNNDLAYNWAEAGVRLDEAERCLRYAVAQQPRNNAFLDSLGWVRYKKGDFAEAIKWLTRASRAGNGAVAPDDPIILDHLGDANWRAGRREAAVEAWGRAQRVAEERLGDERSSRDGLNVREYGRVLETARGKIARQRRGDEPEVAPLGGTSPSEVPTVPAPAGGAAASPASDSLSPGRGRRD
ncbi:MAG: tetratricopeptide repeat protein, partial [Planctomycetota bacterium]